MRELEYFTIEGSFGGNQEWFSNLVMYAGGCAAATACDCCIYFARQTGLTALYPYDAECLSKRDYKKFSQIMKPYLRPRMQGVRKLEWFVEGFQKYIRDVNERTDKRIEIRMRPFSGAHSFPEAAAFVRSQIEAGYPIPCLLLRHKNTQRYKDYIWHWFVVMGCFFSGYIQQVFVTAY